MSFHVELSSNASFQYNTIGNFRNKVQLLHPLEGNWEVAMSDISFTKSWKNVLKPCMMSIERMFSFPSPVTSMLHTYGYFPQSDDQRKGLVRPAYYESVHKLCTEIEKEMIPLAGKHKYLPSFIIDELTGMVLIKPGRNKRNQQTLPRLTQELAEILGHDKYSIKNPKHNQDYLIIPNRAADISAGITSLYVYCNLIVPQYIGDTRAKLLRTVDVPPAKFGEQCSITYTNPHYVPVLTNEFEEIEIDIRDDTNTPIHFITGRTRVKLHFRKCQTHT